MVPDEHSVIPVSFAKNYSAQLFWKVLQPFGLWKYLEPNFQDLHLWSVKWAFAWETKIGGGMSQRIESWTHWLVFLTKWWIEKSSSIAVILEISTPLIRTWQFPTVFDSRSTWAFPWASAMVASEGWVDWLLSNYKWRQATVMEKGKDCHKRLIGWICKPLRSLSCYCCVIQTVFHLKIGQFQSMKIFL